MNAVVCGRAPWLGARERNESAVGEVPQGSPPPMREIVPLYTRFLRPRPQKQSTVVVQSFRH